uniref:Inhibitor I9 domain-containing protein n=1 Tax=Kalanchoe fedtschenkoi TaxID=63787 RepID=A0A7N0UCE2_KALFE
MNSVITTTLPFLFLFSILFLANSSSSRTLPTDPDQVALAEDLGEPVLYIVLTSQPPNGEDKYHFYLRILTRVFDSEEAAKEALVTSYNHAITGFAAKLTPSYLAKLSEQPEVLTIFKDDAIGLHQELLTQATQAPQASDPPIGPALYIVFTSKPPTEEDENQFYLRILTRVFDTEEAAENALVIQYKHAISGFAAKLTPKQVSILLEQPEVLTVIKDEAF